MANLTITAASVLAGASKVVDHGIAAAAVTAGQVVARDANGDFVLADNNSATASVRAAVGFALNGAAVGQPLAVQKDGQITLGAVLTIGTDYWLSDTPGTVCPRADLTVGEYPVMLGIAKTTSSLDIGIQNSGVSL